jgi:hypothetical protein
MLRILTASSLLALAATSAHAQRVDSATGTQSTTTTQPTQSPSDPMTSSTDSTTQTTADPSAQTTMDQTTTGPAATGQTTTGQTTAAAPAAESRAATVQKLVDAEFPTYDANSNGDLDQAEFSKWVLALQGASGDPKAAAMDDAAKAKWATAAFASADADKSKKVSKEEMNTFLAG